MRTKKAQIQLTFNWLYILIAGGVILLFFVGIVVKQKASAEERLSIDVTRVLESIFTASGVSEKTKNFIDTTALSDETLFFDCFEGVGEYGLKGRSRSTENAIEPIFAPKEIRSSRIITWSLPYNLPFKVTDFLMVTSPNSLYYVTGSDTRFMNELFEETVEFENFKDLGNDIDPGASFQVRVVDLGGSYSFSGAVPPEFDQVPHVSGVSTQGDSVTYYTGDSGMWQEKGTTTIVSIAEERDAAKFAAIFAEDAQIYECNMQKVFKRYKIMLDIYADKLTSVTEKVNRADKQTCLGLLKTNQRSVDSSLRQLESRLSTCLNDYASCKELEGPAQTLHEINSRQLFNCPSLY